MKDELIWSPRTHTDRWSADLSVILCLPGARDQKVRLVNFSASAVRISGATGMVEGGRGWLKLCDDHLIAVYVVWVSATTAGCRFVCRPDAAAYRSILAAATGVDRTVISAKLASHRQTRPAITR